MLQDEKLEYIDEQFQEKNMVLSLFGEEVSAYTLYEDIFDDLDMVMPIVFITEEDKHIVPMPIYEALEQAENRNDVLMGGSTYFNNWVSKKSAKDIYTFIIDMDNVYSGPLKRALEHDWKTETGTYIPKPTYIVNSGTGLHLYFVLDEKIPHYKISAEEIDKVYRALATAETTNRVYLKKQVQWFGQDFRMAGGKNKYGWTNSIYRIGEKWDINDLAKKLGLEDVHIPKYGEARQTKPKTQTSRRYVQRKGWHSNPKWYEYTVEMCRQKTHEGNRYKSMCALSVIAWKCNVPIDKLEEDLRSLLPEYNNGATKPIKEAEIKSAMKMYNEKAMLTQRQSLEDWQGWEYKPGRRNGRKRAEHLIRARLVQTIDYPNGEWRNKDGAPSKKEIVEKWQAENPLGTKADCIRETGLTKPTVYKWWR